ncbi:MAG: alpha/beta hydrolase [Chloroflexota bacterium]|nr:alpha/beta hydrolase [Chloroflexota bacterium]
MKRMAACISLLILSLSACTGASVLEPDATPIPSLAPTDTVELPTPTRPIPSTKPAGESEKRCGDGVCDGPENAQNCPEDCAEDTPAPLDSTTGQVADITFATVEGTSLELDAYLPGVPGPHPAVILIHGGRWQSLDKSAEKPLGKKMVEWGYAAFAINYRLAPQFPLPAQIADVQCAIAWVREHAAEYDVDPERIAVLGTSAGGHLAALAGLVTDPSWEPSCGDSETDLSVQAIISCFGVMDLALYAEQGSNAKQIITKLLGEPCQDNLDLCKMFSPINYVSADVPPTLLIHGVDDEAVDIENSQRMADALEEAGADVTFLPIRNAGHAFIWKLHSPAAQIALEAIKDFLDENLKASN